MSRVLQLVALSSLAAGLLVNAARAAEPAAKTEPPRVKASAATTRVTGPLDSEGYVDFVAAMNAHRSKGVTLDNNAYVLLLQALGPADGRLDVIHLICDELGVPRIAEQGDYIVGYEMLGPSEADASGKHQNPLWKQFDQSQNRPWSGDEFPMIAEMVGRNEKPLALVEQAVERPKYYRPMVRVKPDDLMFELLLPDIQVMRSIARALRSRAMLHLGEGRLDDAERDLLTLHKLGSHIGTGQFLIERLVGVACEAIACAGDRQLLCHPQFTAERAKSYRERLLALPPTPRMLDAIDLGERYGALDIVQGLARGRTVREITGMISMTPDDVGQVPTIDWARFAQAALLLSVDWNVAMTEMNQTYDNFVAAGNASTRAERLARVKEFEQQIVQKKGAATSTTGVLTAVFGSNKQRGKSMSTILGALVIPALGACLNAEDNGAMWRELVVVGTALREYRELNGRYPESLDALSPDLLPTHILDRFTLQPLQYRATKTTYLLYSVGINGKDEGGVLGPNNADDRAISDPPPVE